MRIVILSETYAPTMGYLPTMLAKHLARLGADVHLVALDLPPSLNLEDAGTDFKRRTMQAIPPVGSVSSVDGYRVHVLGHRRTLGYPRALRLSAKLRELRADVVYSTVSIGWLPLQAALSKLRPGFRLFTGSHTAASLFPLAREQRLRPLLRLRNLLTRALPGRLVSLVTERCYCPTVDCGQIAWQFFGVQRRKVVVMHLGVDGEYFHPPRDDGQLADRRRLRAELGFAPEEIVCIYTGKMTERKNALIVARAVEWLRGEGLPFRALCIGDGVQKERIRAVAGAVVLDVVHFTQLGRYYRASDIGVWPSYESTSMLDAAACGLPLVISDGVVYREHVDGNGLVCREGDLDSLTQILRELRDPALRAELGNAGATKMARLFSWESVATRRLGDFDAALVRAQSDAAAAQ